MTVERNEFLRQIGLPNGPVFEDRPPPRPVDKAQLRAYIDRTLPPDQREEVRSLMVRYKEWHDARIEVLLERAHEQRKGEQQRRALASLYLFAALRRLRERRVLAVVAAASLLLILGVLWITGDSKYHIQDTVATVSWDPSSGQFDGMEGFPDEVRGPVRRFLTAQKFETPEILLGARGIGHQQASLLQTPVTTAVASDRPTFSWEPDDRARAYAVLVSTSDKFEDVPSEDLLWITETKWSPPEPLRRGQKYYWWLVIKTEDPEPLFSPLAGQPAAWFVVIDEETFEHVQQGERAAGESHLARLALYVDKRVGLLDDAEKELDALRKANPESPVIEKLIQSLHGLRGQGDR